MKASDTQSSGERIRNFYDEMRKTQMEWRQLNLSNQDHGKQNGHYHEHVLPANEWELNLWKGINSQSKHSLPDYIKANRIRKHTGSHNLLSSWVLCANLYFPFRNIAGYEVLTDFLREHISSEIQFVTGIELEYEPEEMSLKPSPLLGELDGGRGAGQTSPDVAFLVETRTGPGLVLVECKFTEHHFYRCSGRKSNVRNGKPNRNLARCLNLAALLNDFHKQCHLYEWERKYWDHLGPIANHEVLSQLRACPAAFDGYQLFRQQSLAEAIAQTGKFSLVVSAVAYDVRNTRLMFSLKRSTGIMDIRNDWKKLFVGKAEFSTFTHQIWVDWVRNHNQHGHWNEWLSYMANRYAM